MQVAAKAAESQAFCSRVKGEGSSALRLSKFPAAKVPSPKDASFFFGFVFVFFFFLFFLHLRVTGVSAQRRRVEP